MQNLRLSGILGQISGLITGQFAECDEDPLMMQSLRETILTAVKEYDYPVCFNFPAGHVDYNLPILTGANVTFSVTKESTELSF
jgi:muramoyltetrapeptide carboxypeptidase